MATDKEPRSSQGRSVKERNEPDRHTTKSGEPEPGTEGPDGPLDDQPQREDEYLSSMLKEFNPQRKDTESPLPEVESDKQIKPGRPEDKKR